MHKRIWTALSVILVAMVLTACATPAPTAAPQPAATQAPVASQPTAVPFQPTAAPVQPTAAPPAKPWKVCITYTGQIGDAGWNFTVDQARKVVEQKLGLQIPVVEGINSTADAERVMSQFAEMGCDEIFTTTNTYGDVPAKVAAKYPNVIIESLDGVASGPPNLRLYHAPFYQANYLLGVIAASVSKTGIGGWINGFPAPPAPGAVSGFALGGRSVNPNFIVKVVILNSYSDPPREKTATESLIAEGADVIGHSVGLTIVQTAEENGVYSFGRMGQCSWAPKYCMGSSLLNWAAMIETMIRQAMDGSWKDNMVYWASVADGSMDVIELDNLPPDVKELVLTTKQKMASRELVVFKGPMKDNTGAEWIPAGVELTKDEILLNTHWAEGIQMK